MQTVRALWASDRAIRAFVITANLAILVILMWVFKNVLEWRTQPSVDGMIADFQQPLSFTVLALLIPVLTFGIVAFIKRWDRSLLRATDWFVAALTIPLLLLFAGDYMRGDIAGTEILWLSILLGASTSSALTLLHDRSLKRAAGR